MQNPLNPFLDSMKKVSYTLGILSLMVSMASCSDTVNQEIELEIDPSTNLSQQEMAICYIVQTEGKFKFKADNQFNLGVGLPVPPEIHPDSACLVWQSVRGSISEVSLYTSELIDEGEPYIKFTVEQASGNALIAALEGEEIVWSWHIWMPESPVEAVATSTGYEVMNMNLGAMNATPGDPAAYGMLYQWGRKDPFPASETPTGDTSTVGAPLYDIEGNPVSIVNSSWYSNEVNTIGYSIANPTVCLSNFSQYSKSRDWLAESDDSLWGNPQGDVKDPSTGNFANKGRKTCYDPSPAGWRVAPADAFADFTTSGGYAWDFVDFKLYDANKDGNINLDDYSYGWQFIVGQNTPVYFPAAARYDGSYAMLMGSMSGLWGNYWSNAPYSGIPGGAFCNLSFQIANQKGQKEISVSPSAGSSRADAFSIRCVRDK